MTRTGDDAPIACPHFSISYRQRSKGQSAVAGAAYQSGEKLTVQMARQEGVTERMKADEPMTWVSRMNGIRSRAEEIIRENVINSL